MQTSQVILLITTRTNDFQDFTAHIQSTGKTVMQVASAQDAVDAVAKSAPALAVIDESVASVSGLEVTRRLLETNAFINTALISEMDDDLFHEKSEGLGVLSKLPTMPTAADAEALLALLDQMNFSIS